MLAVHLGILTISLVVLLLTAVPARRPGGIILLAVLVVSELIPLAVECLSGNTSGVLSGNFATPALYIGSFGSLSVSLAYAGGFLGAGARPAWSAESAGDLQLKNSWLEIAHLSGFAALCLAVTAQPAGLVGLVTATFTRVPVQGFIYSLSYLICCYLALTTVAVTSKRLAAGQRPPYVSMVAVTIIFWSLGGRTQLFVTAASMALPFFIRKKLPLHKSVVPGLFVFVLANLTLLFRLRLQGNDRIGFSEAIYKTLEQSSLYDSYAIAARYVAAIGHKPMFYVHNFQQIIPRAIFPDKVDQLSKQLRLLVMRDELGGLTAGLFGEFYVVGGYLALVLLGLAFGFVLARLDRTLAARHAPLSPLKEGFLCNIIPVLTMLTIRGGFDTSIYRIEILIALTVLAGAIAYILAPLRSGARVGTSM